MKTMRIEWTYDDQIELTIRDDEGVRPVRVCVSSNNLHHLFGELVPKSMHPLMNTRLHSMWGAVRDVGATDMNSSVVSSQPTED